MCGAGLGSQMDQEDTGLQMFTPLKLLGREGSEASNPFSKASSGRWGRGDGSVGEVAAFRTSLKTWTNRQQPHTKPEWWCKLLAQPWGGNRRISGTYRPASLAGLAGSMPGRDPVSKARYAAPEEQQPRLSARLSWFFILPVLAVVSPLSRWLR